MDLPPRSEYEAYLREKMDSRKNVHFTTHIEAPDDEESLARLLHILYEEFDINDEMMHYFGCQEVVDYIVSLFDGDENDITGLLAVIILHPWWQPLDVLYRYGCPHLPPIDDRTDIINRIVQLYLEYDTEEYYDHIWFTTPSLKHIIEDEIERIRRLGNCR